MEKITEQYDLNRFAKLQCDDAMDLLISVSDTECELPVETDVK